MSVPRRPKRPADREGTSSSSAAAEGETPVNGAVVDPAEPDPSTNGSSPEHRSEASSQTAPLARADEPTRALATEPPPHAAPPDRGLYAVLGLDPSASDSEIQTTYRRQAAKLVGSDSNNIAALRQLNIAYETLGNPVRRAEYDRLRLTRGFAPPAPTPIRPGPKVAKPVTRRHRPRQSVQPRYPGLPEVFVVLMVVGFAVLAGALIIPRLSINLSGLSVVQAVLPLSNSNRRVLDSATPVAATPTPAPPGPTPTPPPGLAARFLGSTIAMSNPEPPPNTNETVNIQLRRDGQPVPNTDVWATVQYRTTEERWPASGAVQTDASGAAAITFNIGAATPNYPVIVHVFAQIDEQQLTWSTSFTPH